MLQRGRAPMPYISAMMKSCVTGTYGYYDSRLKGARLFQRVCPAFWLYSTIDDSIAAKGETRYSEVDIVELAQRGDRVKGDDRIADYNLHAILSSGTPGIMGREWHRPNEFRPKERLVACSRTIDQGRSPCHNESLAAW